MENDIDHSPRICIIGAGCSGITAIKNLLQVGLKNLVCFEKGSEIGGNWVYSPKESHSSICETTHIISSRKLSGYIDFPMPEHYPDYPSHQQILEYFQSYATHFGVYDYIQFSKTVCKVELTQDSAWKVELDDGTCHYFDFLIVANGHHSMPRHPGWKDQFSGNYLHAHNYKTNLPFKDEKVLVVGAGNSGCDCAVEISRVAAFTGISMRRAYYIIPKFMMGRPTDSYNKLLWKIPGWLRGKLQKLSLRLAIGKYSDYGLEKPDYSITRCHPTLNSELLYKIRHGKVHIRKGIQSIKGQEVYFSDGKKEDFDTIVAATGYKISFPFFDKAFINFEDKDRLPLYLRMFHPQYPSLIFIGLTQPQGAIWPLSDLQSRLAANYIDGRWIWPGDIEKKAEREANQISQEFLKTKRHVLEVHYHGFRSRLQKEIPANAPAWNPYPRADKTKITRY